MMRNNYLQGTTILILMFFGVCLPAFTQILMPQTNSSQPPILDYSMVNQASIKKKSKRDDLDGAPFMGGHLAFRDYQILQGELQFDLFDQGYSPVLPRTIIPTRTAIRGQLNLFGAMFNDVFDYPQGSFLKDLFFYYSIRCTWNLVPAIREKGGAQHHVELGVDWGAKYFITKGLYAEAGLMTHPFAMSYVELLNIPIEPVFYPDGGEVNELIMSSFHMYVGVAPFARVGFFPFKKVSIDFTVGQNYNWKYYNTIGIVPGYNGQRISSELIDFDNKNAYLNGRSVDRKDYRLGGRMYGIGFTIYMP